MPARMTSHRCRGKQGTCRMPVGPGGLCVTCQHYAYRVDDISTAEIERRLREGDKRIRQKRGRP
jgi:hypothetical protein